MDEEQVLETKRLCLRRFGADDADFLYELDADPEVMRYITGGERTPRAIIESEILPRFRQVDDENPLLGFWLAEVKRGGDPIGWFSIRPLPHPTDVLALGYRLRRTAWGKGYATEGVRLLINKAFSETDSSRIVATTYEKNIGSRRVMEKAGMVLVRRFRLTPEDLANVDTFHAASAEVWDGDDVEYAITREQWLKNRL